MRLTMTNEMRDEYAKKLSDIYNDYSYSGGKTNIPEKLLNSNDYRKLLKDFLKDLIANNIHDTPKGEIVTNFETEPDEGEDSLDELVQLGKDYLIAIDLKRNKKERLYPELMQVPMEDLNVYRDDLMRVMIANEMIKAKMTQKKWIKVWAKQLDKWDKRGINDFAKASTQKSGLAGAIEKSKNKKAVKKQNPSPINLRGLNDVLNDLTEGKNLIQLTPQIFAVMKTTKANTAAPKVNQDKTAEEASESTNEEE